MSKFNKDSYDNGSSEFKDITKSSLNYNDLELFKEEDNLKNMVIRVKRIANSKSEKWKVFEDTKNTLIIDGDKLNNKEKEFLRTVDGVNFVINKYKLGVCSFNAIKKEIKERLKG